MLDILNVVYYNDKNKCNEGKQYTQVGSAERERTVEVPVKPAGKSSQSFELKF